MRANRVKIDELFAFIGVWYFYHALFRVVALFNYVDFQFYLKEVDTKINVDSKRHTVVAKIIGPPIKT